MPIEPVYHTQNFQFELGKEDSNYGRNIDIIWKGKKITIYSPFIEDATQGLHTTIEAKAHLELEYGSDDPSKLKLTPLQLNRNITIYVDLKQTGAQPDDGNEIKTIKTLRSFVNKINAQQVAVLKFEEELIRWSTDLLIDDTEKSNRLIAADRIRECIDHKDEKLDLAGLSLTTLPAGFSMQLVHLTKLNLGSNNLEVLPESFVQLSKLTQLDFSDNHLQSLPVSFGKLENLTILNLSENALESLPESFGQLKNLSILNLCSNALQSLPVSFGKLENLTKLWINDNALQVLPKSFSQLVNLTILNLSINALQSMPESFGQLENLKQLYLNENCLQNLPDSISQLARLKDFYISDNPFRSLPASILNLPLSKIDLSAHNLSEQVFRNFRELLDARRAAGHLTPIILFEMPPPRSSLNPQPIEKSFSTLMSFAQDPELNFDKVLFMAEDHPARLWLNNLLETSDFTTGSEELKKKLSQVVLGFFKYVVEHDEFSEFFRLFLDTANVSCVDRVTMSVIDLEILINLKKAQETSTPPLEQLRAVWATHLLHEIADAKVAKMPLVDALDTHLAYLIQCKEALALAGIELPFSSGKMKFFTYIITGVELSDLEEATTKVLNTMSGPNWSEKFVNFLFAKNNYIAEESLRMFKASYADGIKEIETQKEVLSDQAEELAAKASSDETDPKDKPTDQEVQEAYKAVQEYEKKAYVDLVRSTAES